MKGFRKPTKSEIIIKQREVINSLLKIAEKQQDLIEDMREIIHEKTTSD